MPPPLIAATGQPQVNRFIRISRSTPPPVKVNSSLHNQFIPLTTPNYSASPRERRCCRVQCGRWRHMMGFYNGCSLTCSHHCAVDSYHTKGRCIAKSYRGCVDIMTASSMRCISIIQIFVQITQNLSKLSKIDAITKSYN